jgi:hypothetical protein
MLQSETSLTWARTRTHLRVAAFNVLLHPQEGSLRFVFAATHVAKFGEICLDVLSSMLAAIPRAPLVFAAALLLDLDFVAVAYIRSLQSDQLLGVIVEPLEVVAGVGNLLWCKSSSGWAQRRALPSHLTMSLMATKYLSSSASGLVSSKRRIVSPPWNFANPNAIAMALACPKCKLPTISG